MKMHFSRVLKFIINFTHDTTKNADAHLNQLKAIYVDINTNYEKCGYITIQLKNIKLDGRQGW